VVLATALSVDLADEIDVPDVLERLRRTYPNCYRFLVQPTDEAAFFGPPPERLVELDDDRVRTEALAGSVPRGETPEEDADHAQSLLESEKLQHEQRLVVDAIMDQLSPLGDVSEGEQGVRKLTNIQHLQTPIEATLADDEHVLTIVEALHPTPAVGGLPPGKAWDVIRDTETFERGWYAAPVGWFDSDGDGEFAVGIRSGVAGGRRATLFAGNGIVADSDPDEEWAEVKHKYRPILDELER
jgi:menaquinone-specific isochorismate synthase